MHEFYIWTMIKKLADYSEKYLFNRSEESAQIYFAT